MDMPEYARYQKLAEDRLQTLCETYLPEDSQVCRAARYSLMGGGKRVRAVLCWPCAICWAATLRLHPGWQALWKCCMPTP